MWLEALSLLLQFLCYLFSLSVIHYSGSYNAWLTFSSQILFIAVLPLCSHSFKLSSDFLLHSRLCLCLPFLLRAFEDLLLCFLARWVQAASTRSVSILSAISCSHSSRHTYFLRRPSTVLGGSRGACWIMLPLLDPPQEQ